MPNLTGEEVVWIRSLINKGRGDFDIRHETGASQGSISAVRAGKYRRVAGNCGRRLVKAFQAVD
jgi:hypothetical protein